MNNPLPITQSIIDRCKQDPEYRQEILVFLDNIESAVKEIRTRMGE
jgi:hypothetical protein|tara:strand:- start:233 stop:370 length:138 start_codon:yes stop_codon:yes gene_type:complete